MEKTFPDRSVFGEIRNICQRTGVLTWGELDDSELILLDAPTDSISFTYFDTEQYAVNSGKELPESGAGLFGEIYKLCSDAFSRVLINVENTSVEHDFPIGFFKLDRHFV